MSNHREVASNRETGILGLLDSLPFLFKRAAILSCLAMTVPASTVSVFVEVESWLESEAIVCAYPGVTERVAMTSGIAESFFALTVSLFADAERWLGLEVIEPVNLDR